MDDGAADNHAFGFGLANAEDQPCFSLWLKYCPIQKQYRLI